MVQFVQYVQEVTYLCALHFYRFFHAQNHSVISFHLFLCKILGDSVLSFFFSISLLLFRKISLSLFFSQKLINQIEISFNFLRVYLLSHFQQLVSFINFATKYRSFVSWFFMRAILTLAEIAHLYQRNFLCSQFFYSKFEKIP